MINGSTPCGSKKFSPSSKVSDIVLSTRKGLITLPLMLCLGVCMMMGFAVPYQWPHHSGVGILYKATVLMIKPTPAS
jgi:hypothetical protein